MSLLLCAGGKNRLQTSPTRRLLTFGLLACLLLLSAATAFAQKKEAVADNITAKQLHAYLSFVASDEMEGRDTPSRGLDITAKYIASHLERWDFKPGGNESSFLQRIIMERRSARAGDCKLDVGGKTFAYGEDYVADARNAGATAPLVYAGYGWTVKAKNRDAYQGVEVKGKIVVVHYTGFRNPPGILPADLTGKEGEDYADPVTYAREHGALGVAYLLPKETRLTGGRMRATLEGQGLRMQRTQKNAENPIPVVYLTDKVTTVLFEGEKRDAAAIFGDLDKEESLAAFDLNPAKKMSVFLAANIEILPTQNVVGIWEGSDKTLKEEYVALGAHYDHVGVSTRSGEDKIFNGADDDGSGTVALMAMAEALTQAKRRPKRSVVFVWHCGEEKGMWGSDFFTTFPPMPIESIITQLNIDMIGRSKPAGDTKPANAVLTGPEEIYVVGSKKMSTELGQISERLNNNYLKLKFNYRYDAPNDRERIFYRSDHIQYARAGIPIIFYFDGVHEDYHRVSDHVEKIDFAKMERIARTIYLTLWELTELKKRPVVDKKLGN